jgi:NAD(P)-dependent dehydrogenase (short-subunit alcohol dehydrogenase family)
MSGLLGGRIALVVGASRGIGAATAGALADAGAVVVLAARDVSRLEDVAARIGSCGGTASVVPTDVTDAGAVERLVAGCVEEHGRLDIAVNSVAAGGRRPTPLADLPLEAIDAEIATTLRGTLLCLREEIRAMAGSGGGSIVTVASTASVQPVSGVAGYVTAKFGLLGLCRTAALDHASDGIRINVIAPGPILSEQLERAGEQAQAAAARSLPMRRLGRPEEVAAAAVWLASDASSFVTGAVLPVDGGLLAGMASYGR